MIAIRWIRAVTVWTVRAAFSARRGGEKLPVAAMALVDFVADEIAADRTNDRTGESPATTVPVVDAGARRSPHARPDEGTSPGNAAPGGDEHGENETEFRDSGGRS